jgi:hypothetical protein
LLSVPIDVFHTRIQVNAIGLRNVCVQLRCATARVERSVRIQDDVQRVPAVLGPTGNGRVPEEPSPEDAGQSHADGKHPDCRR